MNSKQAEQGLMARIVVILVFALSGTLYLIHDSLAMGAFAWWACGAVCYDRERRR